MFIADRQKTLTTFVRYWLRCNAKYKGPTENETFRSNVDLVLSLVVTNFLVTTTFDSFCLCVLNHRTLANSLLSIFIGQCT